MTSGELGKIYSDGEVVVRQGDKGDCMYAIQAGKLEVLRRSNDQEVRVAVLGEGDIFGEMSIFEHEVRSATVRALGKARVLTVDKRTFVRRIQEDPSIAFNLVRMMSQRIRRLDAEIATAKPVRTARGQDTLDLTTNERRIEDRRKVADRRAPADRRQGSDRRAGGDRRGPETKRP